MILSDRDIRAAIASGDVGIDPFDARDVQPSSVDLHVDRFFRTFHNARHPFIDVKMPMDDLTEVIEVKEEEAFILHPGEFVLGSTMEYVKLPDHLVARLEGKSSLGRLGLLIHSSLPGDEPILYLHDGVLQTLPIGEVVRKGLEGSVVSFDPETFEIGYHEVTGFFEGAPDRIFEVALGTGRTVRLTGGHDLFTLDRSGELTSCRVHQMVAGTRVAIAGGIPDPAGTSHVIDLIELAPETSYGSLTCGGPTVDALWQSHASDLLAALREIGIGHHHYYRKRNLLPLKIALGFGSTSPLGAADWLSARGGRHRVPAQIEVDNEMAWLLGLYVAEGYFRRKQVVFSNTDQSILDRAQATLAGIGLSVYRSPGAVTCCSTVLAHLIGWLGIGSGARNKRIPVGLLGWSNELVQSFLEGFVDGDGSREDTRVSLWTSSEPLVGDLLLLCSRLGLRASAYRRERRTGPAWQISIPHREHKLLTTVPPCSDLLTDLRNSAGLTQVDAARAAGFKYPTQLNNLERQGEPIQMKTLRKLRDVYSPTSPEGFERLDRLLDGGLRWDTVVSVRDTGRIEPVFDLEVRPSGRRIENLLAGYGGVFVSNTAGYVDPGFEGHLTLELSNVANLPITIYPNMKIGQISFFQLTSPAENPYGSAAVGSKYQGQRGPTPSRYYENFEE